MHTPVPTGLSWRKSTFSDQGENCVELALGRTWAAIRDSKNLNGTVLVGDVPSLVHAVKAGRFNR